MSLSQEKEVIKLEKYLRKQGRDELIQSLRACSDTEKRARLLQQAVLEQEITDTKDRDEKLKEANDKSKELNATYSEQTRVCRKISRFIHLLIGDSKT